VALCLLLICGTVWADEVFGEKESYNTGLALEAQAGVNYNPALQARLENIGRRLVRFTPWSDHRFYFAILGERNANAQALPGGLVYVNQGLMGLLPSDDELAFILGHEISHVTLRHAEHVSNERQHVSVIESLGNILSLGQGAGDVTSMIMTRRYSREMEKQADEEGLRVMMAAGYDPHGAIEILRKLLILSGGGRGPAYLQDHPPTVERVSDAQQLATTLPRGSSDGAYLPRQEHPAIAVFPFDRVIPADVKGRETLGRYLSDRFAVSLLRETPFSVLDWRQFTTVANPSDLGNLQLAAEVAGAEYFVTGRVDRVPMHVDDNGIQTQFLATVNLYDSASGELVHSFPIQVSGQAPRHSERACEQCFAPAAAQFKTLLK
jgi:TolB-like protein